MIDLPGVVTSDPLLGHADFAGTVQMWLDPPGRFDHMLLVSRSCPSCGRSRVEGTDTIAVDAPSGRLSLVADAADPPDPEAPELHGNEAVWERDDGARWEFSSRGFTPSMLVRAILHLDALPTEACTCVLDGMRPVPSEPAAGFGFARQTLRLDGVEMELVRSTAVTLDLASATAIESVEVDGWLAAVVDGTSVVWEVGGQWFELTGMPADRVGVILRAIRGVGALPSRPTIPPTVTVSSTDPQDAVSTAGTAGTATDRAAVPE